MNIRTISYRRVKNLGNYESKAIEVSGELKEGDATDLALEKQESWVNAKLGILPQAPVPQTSSDDYPF